MVHCTCTTQFHSLCPHVRTEHAALTHKCWTFFEWITSISPNFTKHLRHKNALKKLLRKMDWIIVSWWKKIKISFTTHIRQNYVMFVFSWIIDISFKIHVTGVLLVPGRVPSIPLYLFLEKLQTAWTSTPIFFPPYRSALLNGTSGKNQCHRGPHVKVEVQAEVWWRWIFNDNFQPCPMGV